MEIRIQKQIEKHTDSNTTMKANATMKQIQMQI